MIQIRALVPLSVITAAATLLLGVAGCGRSGSKEPERDPPSKAGEAVAEQAPADKPQLPAEKPPSAGAVADAGISTEVSLDCQSVVSHVRSVVLVKVAKIPGATVPLERALSFAATSCDSDNWPAPLRRCLTAVKVIGDDGKDNVKALWGCASFVPPELRTKLEPKLRGLL